ncbi:hypothetical protein [Caulobacter soli]|uniref:hypothetical protein n=1 Tax=Caulobacter soli TaxID=2708539 RepID=UPI0013ED3528|nr:hypothetical protein [Caulobacter soli]
MSDLVLIDANLWAATRSGARAGRGFHYQDAVAAWLAVEAWRGAEAWRAVVPEGVDDITLHGQGCEIRAQLKSRHDPQACFTLGEIAAHIAKTASALGDDWRAKAGLRVALVLERPVKGLAATGWRRTLADSDQPLEPLARVLAASLPAWGPAEIEVLLQRTHLVVEPEPMNRAAEGLEGGSSLAAAAARLAAQQLREIVGRLADANFRAPTDAVGSLGATEVQGRVDAIGALVDIKGHLALMATFCEIADFGASVQASDFYSGVDVVPGHVGAGLVFERPDLTAALLEGLEDRRSVLVAGPSGAGKSALAWLAAYQTRHAVRWYRVRSATSDDVAKLIQMARLLEVGPQRPIGLMIDDVGRDASTSGWDQLVRETGFAPGLLVLGTVREEDVFPLQTLARTVVVRPALDEALAQRIWAALSATRKPVFGHWREPFDLSRGLLLEYTHLLTQGRRLEETLSEQVRRRLDEHRDDELLALRAVSFAAAHAAAIDGERLRDRLGWEPPRMARALQRLIDEHAIRRGPDGALLGLHEIRSTHLDAAVRQILGDDRAVAMIEAVHAVRPGDLAGFVMRVLRRWPEQEGALLDALAQRLTQPQTPAAVWIGVFHGLGLATAERVAAHWLEVSRAVELDDRHSSTFFTLALAGTDFGDAPIFAKVKEAATLFAAVEVSDLRRALLDRLDDAAIPPIVDQDAAHDVAAALLPLFGCGPAPDLKLDVTIDLTTLPLMTLLEFAQTVGALNPALAQTLIAEAGGTEVLLDRLYHEVPWITRPVLGEEEGAVCVSGDVRFISPEVQPDVHADVVRLCELMAIAAPQAQWIISRAIAPDGQPAGYGGHEIASKRMRRAALLAPTRIAWNRAQIRAVRRLVAAETQTGRTTALAWAVNELAGQLQEAADFFCRQEEPGAGWKARRMARAILTDFIPPPKAEDEIVGVRDQGVAPAHDAMHAFATDVQRLVDELTTTDKPSTRLMGLRTVDLARKARELGAPKLWTMTGENPLPALERMGVMLWDIAAVLGDADADPVRHHTAALRVSKTSRRNPVLGCAAAEARQRAARDVERRADDIRSVLARHGLEVEVLARAQDADVGLTLLNVEYLALLEVETIIDWFLTEPRFVAATSELPDLTTLAYAPLKQGRIVPTALKFIRTVMPYLSLTEDWRGQDRHPFLQDPVVADFKAALEPVALLSAILQETGRPLIAAEEAYFEELLGRILPRLQALGLIAQTELDEVVAMACRFVATAYERVTAQMDGHDAGEVLAIEAARIFPPSQFILQSLEIQLALMERALNLVSAEASPRDA